MPVAAIAVQNLSRVAAEVTYSAAQASGSGGNSFTNDGRTLLHIKADGTAPVSFTLTVETPGTVDGQAIADRTTTLAKSKEYFAGPYQPGVYNQVGSNTVLFNIGADATGITVAVLRLP
jgi:hypothetical protein